MCDGDDAAAKFAMSRAPLIITIVTECAMVKMNKCEHDEVSVYAETVYIVEHTNLNIYSC